MMNRRHLLAAEMFSYSYANYDDHLGCNIRFDKLMPNDVRIMERAERENWTDEKIAAALDIELDQVEKIKQDFERAKAIVDAPNAAISFRKSVRYAIRYAVENGIKSKKDVENLVQQVCYRAADLAYLIDMEERTLSIYSEELRKEHAEFEDEAQYDLNIA